MKKVQLLFIHGGSTFSRKKDYLRFLKTRSVSLKEKNRWSGAYLTKRIGNEVEIIRPTMPMKENAKYNEWKIHFERYVELLDTKTILIGSSLGGIFLARYLSENVFPKKIISTYLVCPPFDNSRSIEDLVGGFKLKKDLSLIEKNSPKLYLLFSKNDPVVPLVHAQKYEQKLPKARIIILDNIRGHFQIQKFPQIIKMIKQDIKNPT